MFSKLQIDILDTLSLLEAQAVTCGKVRVGGPNDGGYVMANSFDNNRIGYSIGVGPQVQWDVEMANRGLTIYQYDHTVPGLPEEHTNFRFEKLGIGSDMADPNLIPLAEMMRRNGHLGQHSMLLKIDVEGAEWDVFDTMEEGLLDKFDQIVVEFHGFEYLADNSFRARCARVFRKIARTHTPVHPHANNYAEVRIVEGISIPPVLEMLFCHRQKFDFYPSAEIFPTELDQPCRAEEPDIFLGSFKYKRRAA